MIIACPACATRYVVPDNAIGVEGRTVRCAKCKHSWYQDGPELQVPRAKSRPVAVPPPPPPPESAPAEAASETAASNVSAPDIAANKKSAVITDPSVEDTHDSEPDFSEGDFGSDDPAEHDTASRSEYDEHAFAGDAEDESQFGYEPPFKPRRNIVKYWTWAAGAFAALAIAAIFALNTFGLPSWVPLERPLFATAQTDLEIQFPVDEQERRTLPDGTEYFGAKIIISNTSRDTRTLPPLLIVLRDGQERRVFDWEVIPSQAELAPGETITINEATTEIPRSAVYADIGWAPN